jgi:putative ABC transport system substrate-binding protein
MRSRVGDWIAGAVLFCALAVPAAGLAQPPGRVPLLGVLHPAAAGARGAETAREALEQGLKALGWTPGRTIRIETRYTSRAEELDPLARELVALRPDVIIARSTPAIRVAQKVTTSIPIVMSATGVDPVESGLVASLARPGGNVTGLTLLNQDLIAKHVELLKETIPRLSRVAVLGRTSAPSPGGHQLESAARRLGLDLSLADVRAAEELESAFAEFAKARAGGLVVRADPFVLETHVDRVVGLASRHRLPAIYWLSRYAEAGGLMSYGADLVEVHRRSAYFVDRILKGARPAELPIEEPTKFTLVVNLKTARALGLTIPPSVLARASEVIQ